MKLFKFVQGALALVGLVVVGTCFLPDPSGEEVMGPWKRTDLDMGQVAKKGCRVEGDEYVIVICPKED